MREIEIKIRVADTTKTLQTLKQQGVILGQPKTQHDIVYGQPGDDGGVGDGFIHGNNWLRIRTEDNAKVIFTLKRSVTGQLDSIEHEVTVDNAAELSSIIRHLGFELYTDITKTRQKSTIGDVEICYDTLPQLGTFIELERLCAENADIDQVMKELWEIAETLGLKKTDQETDGYDVLLRRLNGKPA